MPNDKDHDAVNYEITEVDNLMTQEIVSAFVMKQHIPSIIARIRAEAFADGEPHAIREAIKELEAEIIRLLTNKSVWNLLRHGYKCPSNYVEDDDDSDALTRLYEISNELIDSACLVEEESNDVK
jgi:hypothetical protein